MLRFVIFTLLSRTAILPTSALGSPASQSSAPNDRPHMFLENVVALAPAPEPRATFSPSFWEDSLLNNEYARLTFGLSSQALQTAQNTSLQIKRRTIVEQPLLSTPVKTTWARYVLENNIDPKKFLAGPPVVGNQKSSRPQQGRGRRSTDDDDEAGASTSSTEDYQLLGLYLVSRHGERVGTGLETVRKMKIDMKSNLGQFVADDDGSTIFDTSPLCVWWESAEADEYKGLYKQLNGERELPKCQPTGQTLQDTQQLTIQGGLSQATKGAAVGQMVFQQLLAAGSTTTNGTRSIPPLSLESTSIVRTAVSGMCFAMGYFSTPSKAVAENDPRCALDDLQWWYAPATSSSRKKIDAEFPIWYVEHQLLPSEDRDTLTHNIEHLAQRAPFRAYDNMARYLEPLILAQPALQHAFKAIPEAIKLELWCGEPAGVSSAPSGRPPLSSSDDSTLLAQLTLNDRHLRFFDVKSVDDAGGSSKDAPLIPARFFQTLEERQNKSAAQRPMFNTEFKSQVAMPTIRRLLAGNPMIKKLKENNLFTPSADHGQADEDGASFLMELYEYKSSSVNADKRFRQEVKKFLQRIYAFLQDAADKNAFHAHYAFAHAETLLPLASFLNGTWERTGLSQVGQHAVSMTDSVPLSGYLTFELWRHKDCAQLVDVEAAKQCAVKNRDQYVLKLNQRPLPVENGGTGDFCEREAGCHEELLKERIGELPFALSGNPAEQRYEGVLAEARKQCPESATWIQCTTARLQQEL